MILLRPRVPAAVGACVLLLSACTSGGGSSPSSPAASTSTTTARPSPSATAALSEGTVREKTASSCPVMTKGFVQDTVGMRLERVSLLRNDARTVGCRFYALQDSSLARSEHLPGPNQPAVEIVTQRFATALAAHNALVRIAGKGTSPQQRELTSSISAVCFQTDFYPKDKGQDWACGFSKGATTVVVRTVVTSPALNAFLVTRKALDAF